MARSAYIEARKRAYQPPPPRHARPLNIEKPPLPGHSLTLPAPHPGREPFTRFRQGVCFKSVLPSLPPLPSFANSPPSTAARLSRRARAVGPLAKRWEKIWGPSWKIFCAKGKGEGSVSLSPPPSPAAKKVAIG